MSPDEIPAPKQNQQLAAPTGTFYVAWAGTHYAHLTKDRRNTLCGSVIPPATIVSLNPLGKPRCRACLTAMGLVPLPGEPDVYLGADVEPEPSPAAVDKLPARTAVKTIPLPPGFYRGE